METQAQDISNVPIKNDFKVGKFHGLNCVNSNVPPRFVPGRPAGRPVPWKH